MKKYLVSIFAGVMVFGITWDSMAAGVIATDLNCTQGNCVQTNEISDGAVTDAKIIGTISASKIEKPANVITVAQSGGNFTTISAALASLSDPNTTPTIIKVMPGTYTETITLKSNVHLQGSGRDVTVVSPSSAGNAITLDNLDKVMISNFTINNNGFSSTDAAIKNMSSSVVIKDNKIVIDWVGYGIYNDNVPSTKSTVIEGNLIEGIWFRNEYGIYNNLSSSLEIRGNLFKGLGMIGIWNVSSSAMISGNTIENAGWGIYCTGSPITISGNIIVGTGGPQGIVDACSSMIINNRVTGNPTNDIAGGSASNVSFNIFDKGSVGIGKYNVKSDGTPW